MDLAVFFVLRVWLELLTAAFCQTWRLNDGMTVMIPEIGAVVNRAPWGTFTDRILYVKAA